MPYKEILSGVAIVLTLTAFIPYIRAILSGTVKPHVFSWVIWGATTFLAFLAQLEDKGGVGAWPIGVSGSITIFIAFLAYLKRADVTITKTDWLFFVAVVLYVRSTMGGRFADYCRCNRIRTYDQESLSLPVFRIVAVFWPVHGA